MEGELVDQVEFGRLETIRYRAVGPWKSIRRIGPAFVSMTTSFGPNTVLLAVTAGALYRYQIAWIPPLILVARIAFYDPGVRVGFRLPHDICTTVSHLWGFSVGASAGTAVFLSAAPFAAGNVLGTALAGQLLAGGNLVLWGFLIMCVAILTFWFRGIYRRLERISLVVAAIMLFSFMRTLLVTGWSAAEFVRGLFPRCPSAAELLLALAIFATTYGGVGTGHAYYVRAKKYTVADGKTALLDHVLSSALLIVIFGSIMSVGADVLNPAGLVPESAAQFANMLSPLVGPGAKCLFGIGLFCKAFTSVVGQPVSVGLGLADGFRGFELGVDSPFVRWTAISVIVILGLWGVIPVALGFPMLNIYWICSLSSLLATPLSGTLMLMVARRKDIMKESVLSNANYVTLVVLFACSVRYSLYSGLRSPGM